MRVLQLREDWSSQQVWVDRAEEDLICAISMYKRRKCLYIPCNNICYLFLQGIEKWLKLLIPVIAAADPTVKIKDPKDYGHNLRLLYETACKKIPELENSKIMLEGVSRQISLLHHKAPDNFRYDDLNDAEECARILHKAAQKTRQNIKQFLKNAPVNMEEVE